MWSHQGLHNIFEEWHCVKSVPMRSFFWSVFSRIRTEYGEILVFSPNVGKYEPEKKSVFGHFSHSVDNWHEKTMNLELLQKSFEI